MNIDISPGIKFNNIIPSDKWLELQKYIITCGKLSIYINTINIEDTSPSAYFTLPNSPEWKIYLKQVLDSKPLLSPKEKIRIINSDYRRFRLELDDLSEDIIGIQTEFDLPNLNVAEIQAIKECIDNYEKEMQEEKMRRNEHHIDEREWVENAMDEFIDPVSLELLVDPVIASDGNTYSKTTLDQLFKMFDPISPLTREQLVRIGKSGQPGIPNHKVNTLLIKFREGKLKTSQTKYMKYKLKYLNLKNNS